MNRRNKKTKRIISLLITAVMVLSLVPVTAKPMVLNAAGDKTITGLGTGAIENPDSVNGGGWSYVYYGKYNDKAYRYRVLSKDCGDYTEDDHTLFLNSDLAIDNKVFESKNDDCLWADTSLANWLNSTFIDGFNEIEQNAVVLSTNETESREERDNSYFWGEPISNQRVFILSNHEAWNKLYGYVGDPDRVRCGADGKNTRWWTRNTYFNNSKFACLITSADDSYSGNTFMQSKDETCGVSPAFNVDLKSIIFTSLVYKNATKGVTEYKLTLKDAKLNIAVASDKNVTKSGTTVNVPYNITGDDKALATQVSVLLLDHEYTPGECVTDDSKYSYQKLNVNSFSTSGTGTFTLPAEYAEKKCGTDYYAYILAEDVNSGSETDYASEPYEITIPDSNSDEDGEEDEEEWPRDVTLDAPSMITPDGENGFPQMNLTGEMAPVTLTVTDADKYYFPTDYKSLGVQNGITVRYVDSTHLSVSGTPAKKQTTVTLVAPSEKEEEEDDDDEPVAPYYVYIVVPEKSNMTRNINYGEIYQADLTGNMEEVVFDADNGYYFPDNYKVETPEGISVTRLSKDRIKISGKSKAGNANITLAPASRVKINPSAPTGLSGGIKKIIGTTSYMEYADAETPDVWKDCSNAETPVDTKGVKYVRYKETSTANCSESVSVTVEGDPEEEKELEQYTITIVNPSGSNITVSSDTEKLETQVATTKSMQSVYYYADTGYYFPSTYRVQSQNGVRVVRNDSRMITVTGNPTADTTITLVPATLADKNLYSVNVVNGTGRGSYKAGATVKISAEKRSGYSFTGWKVNKGGVTLVNAAAESTSFVMPPCEVEVEACYQGENNNNDQGGSNDNAPTTPGGNNNSETPVTTIPVEVIPLSAETIANNSNTLNLSAKVVWKNGAWKVTWDGISSASGYDVYVKEGTGKPTENYVNLMGGSSTTAYIKTIKGKSVNRKKIYSFVVKAYRVVNQTKDYIGSSRVIFAAGDKHKTYTNIKLLKPDKKTVTIQKGKKKLLQTWYKREKTSKKLMKKSSGKLLSYYSTNTKVATVSESGKVKGVAKGTCNVYAVAHNGVRTKIKIKVN